LSSRNTREIQEKYKRNKNAFQTKEECNDRGKHGLLIIKIYRNVCNGIGLRGIDGIR